MNPALRYDEPGAAASAVLAMLVHGVLFAFLIVGVRWQVSRPEAVIVELWDRAPVAEPAAAPAPEPAPKVEPPLELKIAPKLEAKPEPKVEPKPSKPDIATERQKKAPPKKEPAKKTQRKEEPPVKFDPTQRIREELAKEEAALARPRPATARPAASSIDAAYAGKIISKIKSNIVPPPNIPGNPEAELNIVQLPTGEVLSVTIRKSSGNKVLDDAIERAIFKSSPLPRPEKPEQFQREIRLTYRLLD